MAQNTLKITLWDDSGNEETEHELPAKNAVCPRCEGHGTILNPSIGSHGYSAEEFREAFSEEEQVQAYFQRGGMYDVSCPECSGVRVVPVPDVRACKSVGKLDVLRAWRKQEAERARMLAEDRRTQWFEDGCPRD